MEEVGGNGAIEDTSAGRRVANGGTDHGEERLRLCWWFRLFFWGGGGGGEGLGE